MGRWACVYLVCCLVLSGCADQYPIAYGNGYKPVSGRPTILGTSHQPGRTGDRVAILVPLTGPRAGLGTILLQAAQLAFPGDRGASLDILDTEGTPLGAGNAVHTALSNGDGLILGPLTSSETAAVGPVAQAANVPILAFTNDATQARPGLWPLGISPGQQIRRLVAAAQANGHTRFAALLPDSEFGRAMAIALREALQTVGLADPIIRMHAPGMSSIASAVRDLSDYADRRGLIDTRIKALKSQGSAEARKEILQLQKTSISPPPFDALLLGDTGESLQEVAAVLPYYDVDRSVVQILGPSLWADRASGSSAVQGAWFAAPDSALRMDFARDYQDRYSSSPPLIADVAYDAGLIAEFATNNGGAHSDLLSQSNGFVGSDGLIILMPDGHVRRGLAVFKVDRGTSVMVEPPLDRSASSGF